MLMGAWSKSSGSALWKHGGVHGCYSTHSAPGVVCMVGCSTLCVGGGSSHAGGNRWTGFSFSPDTEQWLDSHI
jgi:hypothetical protein